MVFDNAFAAVGDDQDIGDTLGDRFFDDVLDCGLINDREHFLGHGLCRGEDSCAQSRRGDNCFCDFHDDCYLSCYFRSYDIISKID